MRVSYSTNRVEQNDCVALRGETSQRTVAPFPSPPTAEDPHTSKMKEKSDIVGRSPRGPVTFRKRTKWPFVFVLDEHTVRRLWEVVSTEDDGVCVYAECSDDITRSFQTLDGILGYQNEKGSRIESLTFEADSLDEDKLSVEITFDMDLSGYPGTGLRISGGEDQVLKLRQDLEPIVRETKPWYWVVSRTNVMSIGVLAIFLWKVNDYLLNFAWWPNPDDGTSLTRVAAILVVLTWCWAGLSRLNRAVFPYGYFAIGRGVVRHAFLEKVRFAVLTPSVIAVLAWLWALIGI